MLTVIGSAKPVHVYAPGHSYRRSNCGLATPLCKRAVTNYGGDRGPRCASKLSVPSSPLASRVAPKSHTPLRSPPQRATRRASIGFAVAASAGAPANPVPSSTSTSTASTAVKFSAQLQTLRHHVLGSGVLNNILYLCGPLGLLAAAQGHPVAGFLLCCLGIIPLSDLMGCACEDLASASGPVVGGFVVNTFANLPELMVSVVALKKGYTTVVVGALLGSVICKLLCVIGGTFLVGGLFYKVQHFSENTIHTCSNVLLMSVACLCLPGTAAAMNLPALTINQLSRYICLSLVVTYPLYLLFQMGTHKHLFETVEAKADANATFDGDAPQQPMSTWMSIVVLICLTYAIGVLSDSLVDSIGPLMAQLKWSEGFVALVVLPFINSIGELFASIKLGRNNNMDLAITVAVGSCLQSTLLMIPLMVLLAGYMGITSVNLALPATQAIPFFLSVIVVNSITADKKSNWFEGVLLLTLYVTICMLFFGTT